MTNIQFWKDLGVAVAIISRVIDILEKEGITQTPKWWLFWLRHRWVGWLERGMLLGGFGLFAFLVIVERLR